MYAQLIRSHIKEQKCAEMRRIVADELIPALHDEAGFAGALSLVNPHTGEAIMIVLWQSAGQAQKPHGDNGTSVLSPLLRIAGSSTDNQQPASLWEVTLRV